MMERLATNTALLVVCILVTFGCLAMIQDGQHVTEGAILARLTGYASGGGAGAIDHSDSATSTSVGGIT